MSLDRLADYCMALILLVCVILLIPFYLLGNLIESFSLSTPESEHNDYYHRYL